MPPSPSAKGPLLFRLGLTLPACASSDPSLSPHLSHLSQREDTAELGGRLVNSLVDHGRNSDLSDIQEEEEDEEVELGSRTCSFQKQVVDHSIRENGAKVMGGGGAGGP